jgi:lysophospholipase L1-like esterase
MIALRRRYAPLLVVLLAAGTLIAIRLQRSGSETRREPITRSSVVLFGDSLTEGGDWSDLLADHQISNRGFAGFTTEELVDKADEVARDQPGMVLIMTGTNDIRDGHPPSWTIRHLTRILDLFANESPDTKVVVQTVLPRSDAVVEVEALNQAIVELALNRRTLVLDVHPHFDDGNGGLRDDETTDEIHLTADGYARWAGVLDDFLITADPD